MVKRTGFETQSSLGTGTKYILALGATVLALIPVWIWVIAYNVFAPEGFWQNLVLFGLGIYFLGFLQIIFLVALVFVLFVIWDA